MNKKIKRTLGKILSTLLLCSFTLTAGATDTSSDSTEQLFSDAPVQENAYNTYMDLLSHFGMNLADDSSSSSSVSVYPDYYGGSYTNENNELVICVPYNTTLKPQLLENLPDNYVVKPVTYSYNELKSIMSELNDYILTQNDDVALNINHFALYDDQNRIVVSLFDSSPEKIEEFKKTVSDSPAIVFEEDSSLIVTNASVNPGGKLNNNKYGTYASMGYRAKLNGEVGFVTAAHFAKMNDNISMNGATIAKTTARNYRGSSDAAFCKITNSQYTPSNTISGTNNTLSTTISEPGVSTLINMVGTTSGHLDGYVTSTDATARNNDGIVFTNLTEADFVSSPGDSGGIVYSYIKSTNTRFTIGIISGSNNKYTYICKANEINNALGTTRY